MHFYRFRRFIPAALFIVLAMGSIPVRAERIMTDQNGRRVSVPDHPKRVIALAPSIAEIVCAVGRRDCLIAVTQFSDFPPSVRALPQVGSYIRPDLERIIRLSPDLVLAVKDGNPKNTVNRLADLGIPVYTLSPHDLDSVIRSITEVGGLLNAKEKAGAVKADMEARIRHVSAYTKALTSRPRVFVQIGVSPIVSVGKGSFLSRMVELAGAVNATAGPVVYPRFSKEQVLALNPDILIITSMTRNTDFNAVKADWERWPELAAVRNHRVHILDSDVLDRPGPRMAEGLEQLTRTLYPDFVPIPSKIKLTADH